MYKSFLSLSVSFPFIAKVITKNWKKIDISTKAFLTLFKLLSESERRGQRDTMELLPSSIVVVGIDYRGVQSPHLSEPRPTRLRGQGSVDFLVLSSKAESEGGRIQLRGADGVVLKGWSHFQRWRLLKKKIKKNGGFWGFK